MGNYRFKLSELTPNSWFYKLRDMAKSRKHPTFPPPPPPTETPPAPRPPRRSSYHSRTPKSAPSSLPRRATVRSKSSAPTSSTTSGDTGMGSFSPDFRSDKVLLPDQDSSHSSSCHSPCSCVSSDLPRAATFKLRPIITKPANKPTTGRKPAANSNSPAGVRLRLRSPRISTRKSSVSSSTKNRSSVSTTAAIKSSRRSRAVVKTSVDPRRDFKESMEEMIAENNIRASKDLEELLACYLCLNSDEYHAVIINVFKQLWFELNLQTSK